MRRVAGMVLAALVLASCAAPSPPDSPFPFSVDCGEETPPPDSRLACETAVAAATGELGFLIDSWIVRAEMRWGTYCPPGSYCPITPSNAGHVILTLEGLGQQQERLLVYVLADDSGEVTAGPVEGLPTD
jgi:hypothetical protein